MIKIERHSDAVSVECIQVLARFRHVQKKVISSSSRKDAVLYIYTLIHIYNKL